MHLNVSIGKNVFHQDDVMRNHRGPRQCFKRRKTLRIVPRSCLSLGCLDDERIVVNLELVRRNQPAVLVLLRRDRDIDDEFDLSSELWRRWFFQLLAGFDDIGEQLIRCYGNSCGVLPHHAGSRGSAFEDDGCDGFGTTTQTCVLFMSLSAYGAAFGSMVLVLAFKCVFTEIYLA